MPEKTKVKIFTTPTCPWCKLAKKYLTDQNVEFENIDVSIDPAAAQKMVKRSGEMSVPQFWIGDEVVVGFDKEAIKKLLDIG